VVGANRPCRASSSTTTHLYTQANSVCMATHGRGLTWLKRDRRLGTASSASNRRCAARWRPHPSTDPPPEEGPLSSRVPCPEESLCPRESSAASVLGLRLCPEWMSKRLPKCRTTSRTSSWWRGMPSPTKAMCMRSSRSSLCSTPDSPCGGVARRSGRPRASWSFWTPMTRIPEARTAPGPRAGSSCAWRGR
jgi:hypothetical protein